MIKAFVLAISTVLFLTGYAYAGSFTDNADGTVSDSDTSLMWQQADDYDGSWEEALTYCEGLTLAGLSDWRLPNIKELESITEVTTYSPAIDTKFFPDTELDAFPLDTYWSSTSAGEFSTYAYKVDFSAAGDIGTFGKYASFFVRCVR